MVGDCYTGKSNPQPPNCTSKFLQEHFAFNETVEAHDTYNYYRMYTFIPQRLIRKYRLVRPDEPIQMFDWYKLKSYHEDNLWPAPDKQYNEGWLQIVPGLDEHLMDGSIENHVFIFARFVDCIPAPKS